MKNALKTMMESGALFRDAPLMFWRPSPPSPKEVAQQAFKETAKKIDDIFARPPKLRAKNPK